MAFGRLVPRQRACLKKLQIFTTLSFQVSMSAIEKLPDLVPLLEDHLMVLMNSAFTAGIQQNLDVSSHIADAIAALNSLKGY